MKRLATMDIGTNSVLLLVAGLGTDGFEVVEDHATVTRLGEGLRQTGRIVPAGADRTAAEIGRLAGIARKLGADEILAAGTMALRTAANAADFVSRVERECGVRIRVVDGDEEARLTFLGVGSDLPTAAERLVIFDAGGGSTELIVGAGRALESRRSLEVGAVTLTDDFLTSDPATAEQLVDLRRFLRDETLADLPAVGDGGALIGVGGTVTTMAAVHHRLTRYHRDAVHGTRLSAGLVADQVATFARSTIAERSGLPGMEPARADVILAGAVLVEALLGATGAPEVIVSDRGLRHGLAVDAIDARAANQSR